MSAVRALFTRRRAVRLAILAALLVLIRSFYCPPSICPDLGRFGSKPTDQNLDKYSGNGLFVDPALDELPPPTVPPATVDQKKEQAPVLDVEAEHPPVRAADNEPLSWAARNNSKILIIASMKHDNTSWYHDFFPNWKKAMYVMDDPEAELTVAHNKGRESTAYLTYIIDNYNDLPANMLFLHSQRYQWHNEDPMYDGVPPIENLRLPYVQKHGYANMRCTWSLGCPAELKPDPARNRLDTTTGGGRDRDNTEAAYTQAFLELFPDANPGETPTAVGIPCGAQFALARWIVRLRPRADYVRYRQWLWDTQLPDAVSGRILEYTWHIIMGKPWEHCPGARACFCDKFGLCDLNCPTEGACEKRFQLPRFATIPEGWPEKGSGENGFPALGWAD